MATAVLQVASAALNVLGGLFHRGPDPRIASDIMPAIQRGDVAYLYAWVHDKPPHPADSVAAAAQGLAQLTGSTNPYAPAASGYGGRIGVQPPGPAGASGVAFSGVVNGQRAIVPYYLE